MKRSLLAALMLLAAPLAAAKQPNILVILTDDVGWGDLPCYNPKSRIPAPAVDKLAAEGMRFTHAHAAAALCAPTRYSMLSGNYPWRGRSQKGTWGYNIPSQFRVGQKSIAQMLRDAGYRSAMFGKAGIGGFWGMKPGVPPVRTAAPVKWGFDHSLLIPRGHQAPPQAFFRDGITLSGLKRGKAPDWDASKVGATLLDDAVSFLKDHVRNHGDRPFFLHFCTDGAHEPYVPAVRIAGKKLKGVTGMTGRTDMVHETDILLGELVRTLETLGIRDDTLVIYTSDNGGLPFERAMGHDSVAGLRGKKSTIFEGGTRVPFIASWPGRVAPGTRYHHPIGTHDVVATALDLAGVEKPHGQAVDSVSLAPVLLGDVPVRTPLRDFLVTQSSPGRGPSVDFGYQAGKLKSATKAKKNKNSGREMAFAIYQGDWKLVLDAGGRPVALYDLENDLGEETNLIDRHSDRVKALAAEFRRIRNKRS
ncbi:MAG: sulfatase-like hydrolase/transferase [Akkermansiaceae bacterium]|nr:sulfatase-like hydrolase/transferase [Akkermansiaceae bacterium]MCP5548618.1 sulfatase-like hydrolase/transferase [Akkermansiaceae bacterium]